MILNWAINYTVSGKRSRVSFLFRYVVKGITSFLLYKFDSKGFYNKYRYMFDIRVSVIERLTEVSLLYV